MPRRDGYLTDDDDDTPRRAAASGGGGGVPGWVWVLLGGGGLGVLLVAGLGFAAFSTRREAVARHEVARAETVRADLARPDLARAEAVPEPGRPPRGAGQTESLGILAEAYRTDRAAADARYRGRRVRVWVEVTASGTGWAGASADLGGGAPPDTAPNVVFRVATGLPAPGGSVVIEARCAGLLTDPRGGETLTFTDGRVVDE